MAQEPKAPEAPTVPFTVKVGWEGAPQTLEVKAAVGDIKPWDLDTKLRVVSKTRQPRLEGPLKVTGRAKYTYDISLPGMLWGRMVGAAVPAGEIVKIDTSKAEALPGVKTVWITESRTVRFAGQDVAAVAAVSPEMQVEMLEADYQKARSENRPVPPGFHAHLGYLYFQLGKLDQAQQELETEKAQFPESAVFIDRLLANLRKN
jgi:hypothetical protein